MAADVTDLRQSDPVYEKAVKALSECADDALSEAACGGLVDPQQVIDWVVRAKRLVLYERDRSALRSEVPAVAERLDSLLRQVELPAGIDAGAVVRRFVERLPVIRSAGRSDGEDFGLRPGGVPAHSTCCATSSSTEITSAAPTARESRPSTWSDSPWHPGSQRMEPPEKPGRTTTQTAPEAVSPTGERRSTAFA